MEGVNIIGIAFSLLLLLPILMIVTMLLVGLCRSENHDHEKSPSEDSVDDTATLTEVMDESQSEQPIILVIEQT
jgi:uncharacterized membrane protein